MSIMTLIPGDFSVDKAKFFTKPTHYPSKKMR